MSSEQFAPPGVAFLTSFQYATPSVLQSAFTILVYKDGVSVPNTNISITHVSDYFYNVVCATNSFVATSGSYSLVIYLTASPGIRWEQTIRIDPRYYNVIGNYSSPVATFVASASNGRIMSAGIPLATAVVTVLRPNGTVLLQALTDTNGLWGTVVFDTNGVHNVNVQKSGYAVGTSTINVSGGSSVGPGADISIAATSSGSTMSASDIWAYARRMYQDHVGTKADTEIREAVDDALYMLATAKDWPWYEQLGYLPLLPSQLAGTIALTPGSPIVTLSGAAWPATLTNAELFLPDNVWYKVQSRDSGTQVTLSAAWQGEAVTTGTYQLAFMQYVLPADCRKINYVLRSTNWIWGPDPVSRATLEVARMSWIASNTISQMWAIERDRVVLWPAPNVASMATVLYYRSPARLLSGSDAVDCDPLLLELLRRAVDYQIAVRGTCVAGSRDECLDAYRKTLARTIDQDRTSQPVTISIPQSTSGYEALRYNSRIV
jgi:hypothetical protein